MPQTTKSQFARTGLAMPVTSLMWPEGAPVMSAYADSAGAAWERDLGLAELAQSFTADQRYAPFIRKTLADLTTDPAVIGWRQAVLADFMGSPDLLARFKALLPQLADLSQGHNLLGGRRRSLLLETTDRLSELDLYLIVMQNLHTALQEANPASAALRGLRENLQTMIDDENFQALREELPELQRPLQSLASLTIGVNLDSQLRPTSALLLSINERPFGESRGLLERLLGAGTELNEVTGIAPLHHVPEDPEQRPLSALFQDLDRRVVQVAQPVAQALNRYVRLSAAPLAGLERELALYITAVELLRRLEARGVPLCRPEIAPAGDRVMRIEGLINVNLALRQSAPPVPSDAEFGDEARIGILTGPNSGGKTTYIQAVGLAQALFQAGLLLPARAARLSPVDAIFTHFPALETRQQGRLAEEAARLREIFQGATPLSLVLLNESLSSTTPTEALYLAQDVLAGLRVIGVRALYATHMTDLAARIPDIEAAAPGDSRLSSLIAGVTFTDDERPIPTFQIMRGEPLGRGYAHEIAHRHGISLEQIIELRDQNAIKKS
jgi:hypothetical protein